MKTVAFDRDWRYRRLGEGEWKPCSIPHDAMIGEPRSEDSASGINAGWYEGHDYEYEKSFEVPVADADKVYVFEFEGVYHNAEVYLNGKKAMYRPYGYTNFYVPANEYLKFGAKNELRVIARNADQPNSRWYSGAGIYRPVHLYVLEKEHILLNGVRITTRSVRPAVVEVNVKTSAAGEVRVSILKDGRTIAEDFGRSDGEISFGFTVADAKLWTVETPELYECRVTFGKDERTERFGIRTIACTAKEGLTMNGERVILRGACIHHDNGILGARCYAEAEERKIALLKEYGYNAIRSAHNPCSKALLDACDRLGMLVMDEYADMWYIHKTKYDYALYLDDWWKEDLKDMVEKDFNHPSVVLYSTGNEVGETSEKRGTELTGQFTEYLHSLDPTRFVTCGINIWFNAMYRMGFGQYSDEKAEKQSKAKAGEKKPAVGSEFFNNLAGIVGADFMKQMARLPICDRVTRDAFANLDVAGYNYGILRYKHDIGKYPGRVIVGSETFCADALRFWEFAKKNPALIGDFVWAGMDYLGETGVGSWEYREYAPEFSHGVGWVSAGSGRLDLIGNPLGEALYTKVAFELEEKPQIAVVPVNHTNEKRSPSAWKFSNALPSWSWNGLNGKDAKVEIYSRAAAVELLVNGKRVGKKKAGKNCRFDFKTKYYDGTVTAIAYDRNGKEISRNTLSTAEDETVLTVLPEKERVKEGEVCFVRLRFTDPKGVVKPLEHRKITVEVSGGELLALGSACPFNELGYLGTTTDTYYGEAMAVVRAEGTFRIRATDGVLEGEATVSAEA